MPELDTIVAFFPSQLANGEANATGDVNKSAGATKNVETPATTERFTIRDVIDDVAIAYTLAMADPTDIQDSSKK